MIMNESAPESSRPALIRLLVVLVIVIGFAIYSYGWQVTEIDLEKPQEERRQTNVTNSLQELLSPRIFEQEFEILQIEAPFLMICDENTTVEATEAVAGASITVEPTCGEPGDEITIHVSGFEPGADARIRWIPPEGQSRPREIVETGREEFLLDSGGGFAGTVEVPRIRGSEEQIHQVAIRAAIPSGPVQLSETTENVIRRMIETIFMALVATSIAIPIAALISFFAARNLMRPIRLSLGNLLVAFNGFVIGILLGNALLNGIGLLGVQIGTARESSVILSFVIPIGVAFAAIALSRLVSGFEVSGMGDQVRSILTKVVAVVVLVFLIGAVGGLGILLGEQLVTFGDSLRPQFVQELLESNSVVPSLAPNDWLQNALGDGVAGFGNLLNILGSLIELFMPVIASVIGGYLLSSVASALFSAPLRQVNPVASRMIAGILALVAGAALMSFIGLLGTWAALLGLLSPIITAVIGGSVLVLAYNQFVVGQNKRKRQFEINGRDRLIQTAVFAIGAIIMFYVTYTVLNTGRAVVNGTLPATDTTNFLGLEANAYILLNAIIGGILGLIGGVLAGVRANFPLGTTLYNVSRTILNTVRSIEPLIMGLVFVIWVGIGPFAGVLALTLHSIAALGKLYSEQIENIDEGPIEAIQSTGASWLQTVVYAVVPQIIPPYIAFTMYRWDINVRMSTIIGFVGGGGIGLLLQQQINLLQYRDAGVAVLAIAIVVSILDYASASIRERLV